MPLIHPPDSLSGGAERGGRSKPGRWWLGDCEYHLGFHVRRNHDCSTRAKNNSSTAPLIFFYSRHDMPSRLIPEPFSLHLPASPLLVVTLALVCALVSGSANAQSVHETKMAGQLLNVTRNGSSISCGYRVVVMSNTDGSRGRRVLDVSLFVSNGAMFTKFVGRALPPGMNGLENLVEVPTYRGWLKAPGRKPASPLTELPPGVPVPPPTMRVVDPRGRHCRHRCHRSPTSHPGRRELDAEGGDHLFGQGRNRFAVGRPVLRLRG